MTGTAFILVFIYGTTLSIYIPIKGKILLPGVVFRKKGSPGIDRNWGPGSDGGRSLVRTCCRRARRYLAFYSRISTLSTLLKEERNKETVGKPCTL